jgi:hypothetical protein
MVELSHHPSQTSNADSSANVSLIERPQPDAPTALIFPQQQGLPHWAVPDDRNAPPFGDSTTATSKNLDILLVGASLRL